MDNINEIDWENWNLDDILWITDIDNEFNYTDSVSDLLNFVSYNIDDISDNINVSIDNDMLKFFYWSNLIWFINYFLNWKNKIYLEFIWSKNAKESDLIQLDEWGFRDRYLKILWNIDNDFSVKWLWFFMFKEFISFIKSDFENIETVWIYVSNSNIYRILDKLKAEKIIKSYNNFEGKVSLKL